MPDFGRRDFGRHDSAGGEPSLDAIARSDRLLDALAAGRPVASNDPGDLALAALLGNWRDEVRWPPSTGLVSEQDAAEALEDGLHELSRSRSRPRRGLAVVGSIAAATLVIGGFGAVVAGSEPGDTMYSLRTTLFGEPQSVRDDKVTLAAQTEMAEVQQLIDQGDWDQAQQKLQAVTTSVAQVENVDDKTNLIQQWNDLSMKVGTRDPNATVPPVVPGEPVAPPAPGVTLLELPPVTATTTSTSPSGTSPSGTSPSGTSPSGTTSSATTSDPTAPSSPSDTVTSAPPTSSETTAPSSPSPEPGQQTPTSSAVPPSSAAPVPASPPASAVSPAPAESVPSSAPAIAGSVPPVTATTTTLPPQPPGPAVITPSSAQAPGGGGGAARSGGGGSDSSPALVPVQEAPVQQAPVQQAPNVVVTTPMVPPKPVIQIPIPGFG